MSLLTSLDHTALAALDLAVSLCCRLRLPGLALEEGHRRPLDARRCVAGFVRQFWRSDRRRDDSIDKNYHSIGGGDRIRPFTINFIHGTIRCSNERLPKADRTAGDDRRDRPPNTEGLRGDRVVGDRRNDSLVGAGVAEALPQLFSLPVLVTPAMERHTMAVLDQSAIVSAVGQIQAAVSADHYFNRDSVAVRCTCRFGAQLMRPERCAKLTITA